MIYRNVDCPCCGAPIEAVVSRGEPSNVPPVPPSVEEIIGCACHLYLEVLTRQTPEGTEPAHERYYDALLAEALR